MNRFGWGRDDHEFNYKVAKDVNGLSHGDEIWPQSMA